jgi:hypothetical protein
MTKQNGKENSLNCSYLTFPEMSVTVITDNILFFTFCISGRS